MDKIIVAFETEKSSWRLKEILESSGTAECVLCRSADQVRRAANKLHINAVICSYKLVDVTAEALCDDLPRTCAMLVIARQSLLELCRGDGIRTLVSPVARGTLICAVQDLLSEGARRERLSRPRRSEEEERMILHAKKLLMARHRVDESGAHKLLQRRSMDGGMKLIEAARQVLDEDGTSYS